MTTSVKALILLSFLIVAGEAHAACNVSATGISFGAYDVLSTTALDSTGTVTVACDESPPPDVTVDIGASAVSGGFASRQLRHVSRPDLLNYNLFTSAGRSAIWGDGTGGTSRVVAPKVKGKKRQPPTVLTIYGRIPARQNVSVGAYSDTLTVTITW